MKFQQIAAVVLLSTVLALMISCGVALCRGVETAPTRPNALGVVIDLSNPNDSLVGSVVAGNIIQENGRIGTVVRIHPLGMYMLFDETFVFCGDEGRRITTDGQHFILGNYVFTYRRAASRLINGVPCFALRSVYPIVEPKERFKP